MKQVLLAEQLASQASFAVWQTKLNIGATMVMNNNAAKQCTMRMLDVN